MKIFKFGIHLWIALTSVVSFLAGWIALAHSPKPMQAHPATYSPSIQVTVAPLPTLVPIQGLNFNNNSGLQNSQFNIQQAPPPPPVQMPVQQMPMFQTGGS